MTSIPPIFTKDEERRIKRATGSVSRKPCLYRKFMPGMSVNSYWDSGHRDYWYLINMRSGASKEIPQNGTPYDKLNLRCEQLAHGEVLVKKTSSRGRELPLAIYY